MDAEAAFSALAQRLAREPDVEFGTGFGSAPGLRVNGKIVAMLQYGELVVKLPADRCAAMVNAGDARTLVVRGRAMRLWVVIDSFDEELWAALVADALSYVRRRAPRARTRTTQDC